MATSTKSPATADPGLEVDGLLRMNSSSPGTLKNSIAQKPQLDRHISHIPQNDEDEVEEEEEILDGGERERTGLKSKLKKLKDKVTHHKSHSEHQHEHPPPIDGDLEKHDSGHSEFEVRPDLRIGGEGSPETKLSADGPKLIRKITSEALKPGDNNVNAPPTKTGAGRGGMSKLERSISSIPADDYDSDGE